MQRQIVIAILLASIAALLTYYYINEKEAAVRAGVTPVKVLVAKKPIGRGAPLTTENVTVEEIPGAYAMPGAISAPSQAGVAKQWKEYQGQFAVVPIAKGEQILPNKLSHILPGFAGSVPEGMRIVSFAINRSEAVGGLIRPGNRVDVIGTFEHQYQNAKRTTSVVVAQNVLVTATGEQTLTQGADEKLRGKLESTNAQNICLALSPEDALRLSLAEKEASLKLALRSVGDENLLDLADQNLGSLLGPLMKVRREEIKPATKRFEIIRGLQ